MSYIIRFYDKDGSYTLMNGIIPEPMQFNSEDEAKSYASLCEMNMDIIHVEEYKPEEWEWATVTK